MKKLLMLFSVVLLAACSNSDSANILKKERYHFSENESSCAFIVYNVESAPALTMEDHVADFHFDENNMIVTSSSETFGRYTDKPTGPITVEYYHHDGSQITGEGIPQQYNGKRVVDGIERSYTKFHFSDKEGCFVAENDEAFVELMQDIYKNNKDENKNQS